MGPSVTLKQQKKNVPDYKIKLDLQPPETSAPQTDTYKQRLRSSEDASLPK